MVDSVLVDAAASSGDLSQLEKDLSQAAQSRKTATVAKKQVKKVDESSNDDEDADLPVKLRGKSKREIAEMYGHLESSHGRMANDLGTQRKLTDRLLDLKRDTDLHSNGAPQKVEIKSSELLENPTAALERFSQAREKTQEQRMAETGTAPRGAVSSLISTPTISKSHRVPDFAQWVQASPIRVRAAQAVQAGDWSLAGDLLSEFKITRQKAQDEARGPVDEEAEARAAAKKASLESGSQGNAGAKKGGKIYRRADLMRLKAERRDVYEDEDFQREILLAYAEGRVK
jgi:hypothetical protein